MADVLNVRGGPGTAYAVVGQAKAGQTYPIAGKSADGKWLVVDLGGKQGWVLGQYVKARGRSGRACRREGAGGAQSGRQSSPPRPDRRRRVSSAMASRSTRGAIAARPSAR